MKFVVFLLLSLTAVFAAAGEIRLYAAPAACGSGDGSSPQNAARLWDHSLWQTVRKQLQSAPVTLELAAGKYVTTYPAKPDTRLNLIDIGHPEHTLTIRGAAGNASCFMRDPADSKDAIPKNGNLQNLVTVRKNCRNIVFEQLYFTGSGMCGYALQIRESRDITLRNCHWKDMRGVYYGASGAWRSHNVTWENCTFANIGYDVHAHVLYNLSNCTGLTLRNCRLSDSYGDFVRFRDRVCDVVVENCEFIDNGLYDSSPFLAFPLFIDFEQPDQYEYFSTGLTVRNNKFIFKRQAPRNWMMAFHISGYNPPEWQYLVNRKDAAAMAQMSRPELRQYLDTRFGLQTGRIFFSGNTLENAADAVVYECWPKYGSEKKFPPEDYRNTISLTHAFID